MCGQCPQDDIALETQAQVDSFAIVYSNCTELEVSLQIGKSLSTNVSFITNLNQLSQITSVGGDINILNNVNLASLSGLSNVTYIEGRLLVVGNYNLTNLTMSSPNYELWMNLNSTLFFIDNKFLTNYTFLIIHNFSFKIQNWRTH